MIPKHGFQSSPRVLDDGGKAPQSCGDSRDRNWKILYLKKDPCRLFVLLKIQSFKSSVWMYALNDIVLLRIFVFRIITKIMDYIQFHMKKIPLSFFCFYTPLIKSKASLLALFWRFWKPLASNPEHSEIGNAWVACGPPCPVSFLQISP